MRYFLTFFILFSSNAYAINPDSLPDDPWMKNFWGGCGYHPIKRSENDNVFWRFTLEKGDRGGCHTDVDDNKRGSLFMERKEVRGRKLKSDATYEVQFKARFVAGFVGENETFFQVHGFNGDTCSLPLLMFKFGTGLSPDQRTRVSITEKMQGEISTLDSFGAIDKIRGIWQHVRFIFETNVGTSKYWLYLGDKLLISEETRQGLNLHLPGAKYADKELL